MSVQGPPLCYLIKTTTEGEGRFLVIRQNGGGGVFYQTPVLTRRGKSVNLMCIATHVPTGLYIGFSYENRHRHIVELCIKITKF